MRVHLLGTGGAGNECRHQASLLVESRSGQDRILLDTGNGLDVVRRLQETERDPLRVRDIFVSHRHIDHAGGLEPLLLWQALQHRGHVESDVRIYTEPRVIAALKQMLEAIGTVVPMLYKEHLKWITLQDNSSLLLGDGIRFTTFLVDHGDQAPGALGCVLEMDGKRIAYSGDTRPCARLAEATVGVDVLFHEAGGLDEDGQWVHMTGHSTAGDAARAARAAGAARLVLTHFPDERLVDPMLAEAQSIFKGPVEMATESGIVEI